MSEASTASVLAPLRDPSLLKTQALIGGRWVDAAERVAVHDPATGALLAEVPRQGAADAERAIEAAAAAWEGWRRQTARQRATVLRRWFDLLLQHADDLALIMTAEQGKPLAEAKGEIAYGASFVEWFAEEAKRVYGETIPSPDPSKRLVVLRQPIGVCAAITPWNFPLAMITRKVAPALAAGCPVVIKPAEQTPLTALAAAELAQRAGMPPGVLNMLTSDAAGSVQIGKVLCASDVVRHLSFTGSTEVGRILMAQSAPTVKKLSLELGGNAPFIVFDDADVEAAVEGAMQSKYRNAGQTCVCANRLYVQRGVYEEFVGRLARRVAELKVGPGTSAGVQIGPLIDQQGLDKVRRHVDDALARGARLLTGGKVLEQGGGRYFEPTVLADADASMLCAREETFGPVAPVFVFDTEEQAIAAANATEFGLAAYFYSRDLARVTRVGEALEYGIVGVNTGLISNEVAPFGGVKQSGLGREGSHHGIDEYLELKYLCVGGIGA
ncbi:NAD-dependent succinate-semialdehyde dehydrogenase [Thiomonas sp. FB-6]|uniref:NAD-dependent succinate-semialdehyde dehydrogenase n=1 Tax=Thiomonas sp. FB-6 TaxID=1158291 RepID=UPI00036A8AD7|nr:NAD-dependent succinate-semialdehyde dehydrogenase [Thiomonas sp. FB-6]